MGPGPCDREEGRTNVSMHASGRRHAVCVEMFMRWTTLTTLCLACALSAGGCGFVGRLRNASQHNWVRKHGGLARASV